LLYFLVKIRKEASMSPTTTILERRNGLPAEWRGAPVEGRGGRADLDARSVGSVIAPRSERPERKVFIKLSIQARLSDLPGKRFLLRYLSHLYRNNRRPSTLELNYTGIRLFLEFIQRQGVTRLEEITRGSLEAFIEHEQDRGLKPNSVRGRLTQVKAFLRFFVESEELDPRVLSKRLSIKPPESLPRAMDPEDVRELLSVVDHIRNRAMVLMLLRTGMRIGELLDLREADLDLRERRVLIYEAQKTRVGRVVFFSDDAREALNAWLRKRIPVKPFVFYSTSRDRLTYAAARRMFVKYLKQAGLSNKGYTIHCLRHTFASELLNSGMRLECLQHLLGHTSLEVTRRYARLTDRTREEEYFRAMTIIEKGGVDGQYRFADRL
jgi:site-specific recombinase XerD